MLLEHPAPISAFDWYQVALTICQFNDGVTAFPRMLCALPFVLFQETGIVCRISLPFITYKTYLIYKCLRYTWPWLDYRLPNCILTKPRQPLNTGTRLPPFILQREVLIGLWKWLSMNCVHRGNFNHNIGRFVWIPFMYCSPKGRAVPINGASADKQTTDSKRVSNKWIPLAGLVASNIRG